MELAKLARKIRDRIRSVLAIETENGPVTKLMKAFQQALLHDLDADSFADMYAQTIAYGLLSARVANPKANTADGFAAQIPVTNPFLKELMETFLHVGGRKGKAGRGPGIDFDELGVSEVVELLDDANMEAVIRDFGDRNAQEDPVIHFYELFLKEYDAKKRMQRGVFYTPRPVVSYIVRSVHELLQTDFGLADGLADTATWGEMASHRGDLAIPEGMKPTDRFVTILDPATGTGTFLVEAIDIIHRTLADKWKRAGHGEKQVLELWNDYVPRQLLPRLHGYELLMAPYAIAHLKIGLKLHETGYRFGSDERARIYLTNALEPAHDFSGTLAFAIPALAHEAEAVNAIKRHQRFSAVIGNPPYSLISANMDSGDRALVERYKYVGAERIRERGALQLEKILNDDYVKFIAKSQDYIARTGMGLLGFITNHAYLDNPTMRGLRHSLMESFGKTIIYDLGGSAKKSGGDVDENVFDIQQGVAIGVFVSNGRGTEATQLYARISGTRQAKYGHLAMSAVSNTPCASLTPTSPFYLFIATDYNLRAEYERYAALDDVFTLRSIGLFTSKDSLVVDWSPDSVERKVHAFQQSKLSNSELCDQVGITAKSAWNVTKSRQRLAAIHSLRKHIVRFLHRPFDSKYLFYERSLVWSMAWPVNRNMLSGDNLALTISRQLAAPPWNHVFCSNTIVELCYITNRTKEGNHVFPLYALPAQEEGQSSLVLHSDRQTNFRPAFLRQLKDALGSNSTSSGIMAEDIFHYAYAVYHSPAYRVRYAEFLKIDFPRLPLTSDLKLFRELAFRGRELVALHLIKAPPQVAVSAHYQKGANSWRYEAEAGHQLPITLAFSGPEKPVVSKVGWSDDTVWIDASKSKDGAADIKVTGTVGFRGVPEDVWKFHVGGYQVCEKWLKDRKDRNLTADDIAHYHRIVIALHETNRLMREIDEVIAAHGGWPAAFQAPKAKQQPGVILPFKLRIVRPRREDRYVTCVPLVPLKVAAGAFSDPQHIEDDTWEWATLDAKHRLRPGMFIAQVVGKSMEPAIPDGSFCLFAAPVTGTRQGKTVLVQLRDATDPETGERYTVKRYESEKVKEEDSWRHTKITLKPINPDFQPIVLTGAEEGQLQVIAECIEVLGGDS